MKKCSLVDLSGETIDKDIAIGTWLPLYSTVSKSNVENLFNTPSILFLSRLVINFLARGLINLPYFFLLSVLLLTLIIDIFSVLVLVVALPKTVPETV